MLGPIGQRSDNIYIELSLEIPFNVNPVTYIRVSNVLHNYDTVHLLTDSYLTTTVSFQMKSKFLYRRQRSLSRLGDQLRSLPKTNNFPAGRHEGIFEIVSWKEIIK